MSKKYVVNVKVNADFVVQAIDPEFAKMRLQEYIEDAILGQTSIELLESSIDVGRVTIREDWL